MGGGGVVFFSKELPLNPPDRSRLRLSLPGPEHCVLFLSVSPAPYALLGTRQMQRKVTAEEGAEECRPPRHCHAFPPQFTYLLFLTAAQRAAQIATRSECIVSELRWGVTGSRNWPRNKPLITVFKASFFFLCLEWDPSYDIFLLERPMV